MAGVARGQPAIVGCSAWNAGELKLPTAAKDVRNQIVGEISRVHRQYPIGITGQLIDICVGTANRRTLG